MNLQEMLTEDGFFRPLSNIVEAYVDLPAHHQRLMYADVKTEAGKLEVWVWISRLNAGDTTESPACPTCGARRLVFWPDAWTVERDVTHRCDGCGSLCQWDEGGEPCA